MADSAITMRNKVFAFFLLAATSLHAADEYTPGGRYKVRDMSRPQPRIVTPPAFGEPSAPSDAVVLFDGTDLSKWKQEPRKGPATNDDQPKWNIGDGYFEVVPGTGTLRTREKFKGDTQWHIEWAAPSEVKGNGQGRGNSGVFIGGYPEVQVLDSYQNITYPDGQAAGLYGFYPPMVNASRKPGEWQTYDIIAERQRRDAQGKVTKKARLTVIHNGIVAQWGREFDSDVQEGDLALQDHNNPVRYRNIWVRPINLTDPDSEGTPAPTKNATTPAKKATPAAATAKPIEITMKTLRSQMRYDLAEFSVPPSAKVKLTLINDDEMPHNIAFCDRGTDVLDLCAKMMERPEEALKRNWAPDDKRVWLQSKTLEPKQRQVMEFTAPSRPGNYPYVCTFPGHAMQMRGMLKVAPPGPRLTDLKFTLYHGAFRKVPDFSKLKPHREGRIENGLLALKFDDYKNEYGIVFTGKLKALRTANYTFHLTSDDGSRLYIDDKDVVAFDGIHPADTIRSGRVKLEEGEHDFRLEYFQAAGRAELFVAWEGGGFAPTALSEWKPKDWKKGGAGKQDKFTGLPITVGNEPVIYRNFIAGAGNRGIGVGYPGNMNIAWSAESMNLAIAWRGAFIDAARHWRDRGGGAQPPLGQDPFRPTELSPPFAVLTPGTEWPKIEPSQRAEGYSWKGYRLDAKRYPTFNYEWQGVKVTDRFETDGDAMSGSGKLQRIVKLEGNIPAGALFRAAAAEKVTPQGSNFLVEGGPIAPEIRSANQFMVEVEGARLEDGYLVVPARSEIIVNYTWVGEHADSQHQHHTSSK